jgi:hypothetical protein
VPAPTVSEAAQELYEGLGIFTETDEAQDWALLRFCDALAGSVLQQIHGYVTDQDDGTPGWSVVMDPDQAPAEVLPWLAQFAGVEFRQGMTESEQRAAIKLPEGFNRGTPAASIAATKRHLTGSKTVLRDERYGGHAYQLRVRTLLSETPDPAVTQADVISQKPIGIKLIYEAIDSQDWGDLRADHATWTSVRTGGAEPYATWFAARTDLP